MSHTTTFDDVWKMFQETSREFNEMIREDRERRAELDRKFQETDRKFQETDRQMKETDRKLLEMFQETDRQIKENALQMKETDRQIKENALQMKETDRQIKENALQMKETDVKFQETDVKFQETFRETDRQIKENALQMKETDRKLKEVSTLIGNLGGRWGEFVEGLVAPACITMFAQRGIPVDEIYPRVKKNIAGVRMEIDILVANTVAAVLVEVKSHLEVKDVRRHLEHRLSQFKANFPRYATCQVYGAVAGIVIEAEAEQFAIDNGLFVIVQSGDTVLLANSEDFAPRVW